VAQDGFVKAYFALDRFQDDLPFRPWLLQIVANEARNRRKSVARRYRLALRAAEQFDPTAADPAPENALLAGERRDALLAAIEALRDEERLVVTCRYLLELSEAETAVTLGVPQGTVKSRLSRALSRLRTLVDPPRHESVQGSEPDAGSRERPSHG
jgi:RNA polymerase sigma-70 factor, ECF subfamily